MNILELNIEKREGHANMMVEHKLLNCFNNLSVCASHDGAIELTVLK